MAKINAFLNGSFLPVEEAHLNIEDRGTLFGDGVYEFVRIEQGRLFQAQAHLDRFWRSAEEVGLSLPYGQKEMQSLMAELVCVSEVDKGGLYLQATRGVAVRIHHFPVDTPPTFFMVARDARPTPETVYTDGVEVTLLPDERWKRCDIKSLNLLPNVLAKEKAVSNGFFDAIFISQQGITEATSSSVLAVYNGKLTTTPQGHWILPGITCDTIIELAGQLGIPVSHRFLSRDELLQASEVILTNTRADLVPVVKIDGATIGEGKPGKVYKQVSDAFKQLLRAETSS
jgi:D-alanine transaminase